MFKSRLGIVWGLFIDCVTVIYIKASLHENKNNSLFMAVLHECYLEEIFSERIALSHRILIKLIIRKEI
jgi:hypothetical protein